MRPDAESKTSVVIDIFTGLRLWKGAELYFQPELAAGLGLSTTLGVADFPSGEVYRVGDPKPVIIPARATARHFSGTLGQAWSWRQRIAPVATGLLLDVVSSLQRALRAARPPKATNELILFIPREIGIIGAQTLVRRGS